MMSVTLMGFHQITLPSPLLLPIERPISCDHMRAIESTYAAKNGSEDALFHLMENAGAQSAKLILHTMSAAREIIVLAGHGNNGGDGFVLARVLSDSGRKVRVFTPEDKFPSPLCERAKGLFSQSCYPLADFASFTPELGSVIVDALLGTGINRHVTGDYEAAISHLARLENIHLIALDCLSGLCADTGKAFTKDIPSANKIIAFHRPKFGHFILPAKAACRDIFVVDIGLPSFAHPISPHANNLWEINQPVTLTPPCISSHKYQKGVVAIKAADDLPGATALAALAARRTGVGMVMVFALARHASLIQNLVGPGLVVKIYEDHQELISYFHDPKITAVIIGPGEQANEQTQETQLFPDLLTQINKPMVLDAGALSAFANASPLLHHILCQRPQSVVLTPHAGEYQRIFPLVCPQLTTPERAKIAADTVQQTVLLKGNDTSIASPHLKTIIETNATPRLATAGSGDVLSGIIAGLIAQKLSTHLAAAYASHLQAKAASLCKQQHIIAEDLIQHISP